LLLHILSNGRDVEDSVDAEWAKESRVADTRTLQNGGSIDSTSSENDFFSDVYFVVLASTIGLFELNAISKFGVIGSPKECRDMMIDEGDPVCAARFDWSEISRSRGRPMVAIVPVYALHNISDKIVIQ
jgi:hypothetical protein